MAKFWRTLICLIFGECWRIEETRRRIGDLETRVDCIERGVTAEKTHDRWRPSDAFRAR